MLERSTLLLLQLLGKMVVVGGKDACASGAKIIIRNHGTRRVGLDQVLGKYGGRTVSRWHEQH